MSQCPCGGVRGVCEYHPDVEPDTERSQGADDPRTRPAVDPSWRLLGPDDPAVSTDLIYVKPDGTLVSVPANVDMSFERFERESWRTIHLQGVVQAWRP